LVYQTLCAVLKRNHKRILLSAGGAIVAGVVFGAAFGFLFSTGMCP
jgi:hypothetical protein